MLSFIIHDCISQQGTGMGAPPFPPYFGALPPPPPPQPFAAPSFNPYTVPPQPPIPPLMPPVSTHSETTCGECANWHECNKLFDITYCILNFISVLSTFCIISSFLDSLKIFLAMIEYLFHFIFGLTKFVTVKGARF